MEWRESDPLIIDSTGISNVGEIDSSTATTAAEDIIHFNQWEVKINAIPSPNEIHFRKAQLSGDLF